MKVARFGLFGLALSFLSVSGLYGTPTTYLYTGNNFNNVTPPFTTSDFVTARVTLSSPLPSSITFTDFSADVISFSLSDGFSTITNAPGVNAEFFFETAGGAIVQWAVEANGTIPVFGFQTIGTFRIPGIVGAVVDFGGMCSVECRGLFGPVTTIGFIDGNPSTWSVEAAAPVPEPLTITTMVLAMIALVGVVRFHTR